jgi:actin-related protein
MATILFEEVYAPAMFIQLSAVLALHSSGRDTGLVVDIGHGVTNCVPVFDGYALTDSTMHLDVAGADMINYLMELLTAKGICVATGTEREIVCDIKEKRAYVALDFDRERGAPADYEMPDGTTLSLSTEPFQCAEILFRPSFAGSAAVGVADMATNCISQCDTDIRRDLYQNIVLAGGTCALAGLVPRMEKEMMARAPIGLPCRVVQVPEPKVAAWVGGSILASLSTFDSMWLTRAEYDEMGPNAVHRKCL